MQALSAHSLCVFVLGLLLLLCGCVVWLGVYTRVWLGVYACVWCCVGVCLIFCSITLGSTCVGISRLDWAPWRARACFLFSLRMYVTHPHSHAPTTLDEIQHSTDLTDLNDSVEAVGWGPTFDSLIGGPPCRVSRLTHSVCLCVDLLCSVVVVWVRGGVGRVHTCLAWGVCVRVWCCVGVGLSFYSITLGSTCVGISRLDWAPWRARACFLSFLRKYV